MDAAKLKQNRLQRHRISRNRSSFEEFATLTSQTTTIEDWPFASSVENNILIYSGENLINNYESESEKEHLLAELAEVFLSGPGVIAIKGAIPDELVIDEATSVFEGIIDAQRKANKDSGDHFAKAGSNDRIWNAVEKHCEANPKNFIEYYANAALAIPCEAWLGPGYQMTAQVNRVNPGGQAQKPHRDYHLGFMVPEQMEEFPGHVHQLSPMLTLQGAVSHCIMPLESGPTQLLPYSQQFLEGYLAFGGSEFQDWFKEKHVQLPLEKGDAVFFNPALMHAAGNNSTKDLFRLANLLQISSPFGRAMETVNHSHMVKLLYPELLHAKNSGALTESKLSSVVNVAAEGYPFPTNLDTDPPINGLAPNSQAKLLVDALMADLSLDEFVRKIDDHTSKRQS